MTLSGKHGELATQHFGPRGQKAPILSPGVGFDLYNMKHISTGEILMDDDSVLDSVQVKILRLIADAYRISFAPLLVLAFIAFIANLGYNIRQRMLTFSSVLQLALFGAALARMLILAIVDITMFPAIKAAYIVPLYPLAWLFILMSIGQLLQRTGRLSENSLSLERGLG